MTDRQRLENSNRSTSTSRSDQKRAKIAVESPEGTPAQPKSGPKVIGLVLAGGVVALLAAAVLIAALLSPVAGIAMGGFAVVLFLVNPAVWAAVARADERDKID